MKQNKLIITLKEGVTISEILPNSIFGEKPKTERLHDITKPVNQYKKTNQHVDFLVDMDDETIFETQVKQSLSKIEQKMHRSYTVAFHTDQETKAVYELLHVDNRIECIQYNQSNRLCEELPDPPNDALYGDLWALDKIKVPLAWHHTTGSEIIVAVVDSGVDSTHPDIEKNMWKDENGCHGYDFSDNDSNPADCHGHGTHVAGIIAAMVNNKIGCVGVAPNVKIMAVKVFPNSTDDVLARGIKYAVDNGAHVINCSWGPITRRPSNPQLEDTIEYAISKGVTVICAAGNQSDFLEYYAPANHKDVISVAATDQYDRRAYCSNHGEGVTVAAPGVSILSLGMGGNGYMYEDGTSVAAPHVTGLVALIKSLKPDASPELIKKNLQKNADPIHTDKPVGMGRINALRSVENI